jgi:chromosome segregation ATPase
MSETMTRSLERQKLAEAIGKLSAANEYHDKVAEALQQAEVKVRDGWHARDLAEAAVTKARELEGARLVASLVPGQEQGISLADAEAAQSGIASDLKQARTDRDRLKEELNKASQAIGMVRPALQRAVRAVVTAEGGVLALKARYEALRAQAAAMEQALNLVSFALPPNPLHLGPVIFGGPLQRVESPLEAAFKRALVALESDPDAPLPC